MGPINFSSISRNALNKVLLVIAIILSSACSTFDKSEKTSKTNQSFHLTGSFGDPQRHDRPTRSSAVVESSVGLLRRSLVADPIVRPFSTLKAFYGYTLKSTTGFLERAFIQNVRFPLLERKPIPGLTNNPPMDLADWELELDQITGTRLTRGSISLLVDGEEYFERLYESIDGSDKSISIRTYIFDNDDVALELADHLRERSKDVEVKIMVDGLADIFATRIDSPSMPADVDLPPSMSDYITYESRVAFRKQSNPWFTGDHVKITLIDEDVAFIGGMNIGRE